MNVQESDYRTLGSTDFPHASQQNAPKFTSQLSRILKACFELVFKANELTIYESKSRLGTACWTIYDPVLERNISFDSETELRAWLERRYYT